MILGIGTDIVPIGRIDKIASRDERILRTRLFGPIERDILERVGRFDQRVRLYAQHIAAKESVFKALGTGMLNDMSWRDVQVVHSEGGFRLETSGATAKEFAEQGISQHWLSLGCTRELAIALVTLIRRQ